MLIISRNSDQSFYIFQNDQKFHVKVLEFKENEAVEIGITTALESKKPKVVKIQDDFNLKKLDHEEIASFNILLVEDSPLTQKITSSFLEKLGHTYNLASTGKDAISCAKTNNYDLIFLNIELPDMCGLEVLKTIRQYEQEVNIHTPIVILTTKNKKLKNECTEAGADLFTPKPLSLPKMKEIIDRYR